MFKKSVLFFALAAIMLSISMASTRAYAIAKLGSGYTVANFFSLATYLAASYPNADIPDSLVDAYSHIFYCDLARDKFYNEFEWEKIRENIGAHISKIDKEYHRYYEFMGTIHLDKYDFKTSSFPVSHSTAVDNVGIFNIYRLPYSVAMNGFCYDAIPKNYGTKKKNITDIFPSSFFIKLPNPITIKNIKVSSDKAKYLISLMAKKGIPQNERKLYLRFRVKLLSLYNVSKNYSTQKVIFNAALEGIDVFVDPELTIPFTSIKID